MNYTIYKVTSPNNKVYIGVTSRTLHERKLEHLSNAFNKNNPSNYKIHNAIRKYKDEMKWEIIDNIEGLDKAILKEKYYIALYDSFKKGYNLTVGGETQGNYIRTEEQKLKNSQDKKEYFQNNPKAKERAINALKRHYEQNPNARSEYMKKYHKSEKGKEQFRRQVEKLKAQGRWGKGKPAIKVKITKIETNEIFQFNSISEASRNLNISIAMISKVLKNKVNSLKFIIEKIQE